jgi:hypothetical protein
VVPETSAEQIEPPTEDAIKFITKLNNAKQELIGTMKEFNKLLSIKTLPINKSSKEKEHENRVIDELIRAAVTVDRINAGQNEGVISVSVFSVRLSLLLRNAGNELAHEVQRLNERISALEAGDKVTEENRAVEMLEASRKEQERKDAAILDAKRDALIEEAKKIGLKLKKIEE